MNPEDFRVFVRQKAAAMPDALTYLQALLATLKRAKNPNHRLISIVEQEILENVRK